MAGLRAAAGRGWTGAGGPRVSRAMCRYADGDSHVGPADTQASRDLATLSPRRRLVTLARDLAVDEILMRKESVHPDPILAALVQSRREETDDPTWQH